MTNFFEQQIWGNTVEEWSVSLLILVITIAIAKLISLINRKVILPFTKKTQNKLDDILFEALESPLIFAISLLGIWISIHNLSYPQEYIKIIDTAYRILITLNATWFFARLSNGLISVYWTRFGKSKESSKQDQRMMPILNRTITIIIWITGLFTALSNVGVNISALLGTLGIGGIAFALAAQDTIKNVFAAFTILTDKPFSIGDTIRIDSYEGTVIDVGIRSTKIRNYDKRIITLPNYKISDTSVINISAEPMRRVVMKIGLTYDTTPEKMEEAMAILRDMPNRIDFVSPKDLTAYFTDFADSAMIITFIYYIEKKGDNTQVRSNVNLEILKTFNAAGLVFAYPTQTVFLSKE